MRIIVSLFKKNLLILVKTTLLSKLRSFRIIIVLIIKTIRPYVITSLQESMKIVAGTSCTNQHSEVVQPAMQLSLTLHLVLSSPPFLLLSLYPSLPPSFAPCKI